MTDTTYSSTVNTFVSAVLDVSLTGAFDDASGYPSVRVWVNTPGNCNLKIFYSDNLSGANYIYDSYPVYANKVSSISALKKKRYVKVQLLNVIPTVSQTNVLMRTKFVSGSVHPFLNYSTDDVTANLSVVLEDFNVSSGLDHSGSSLQLYGRTDPINATAAADKLAHRPIRTDACGNISVSSLDPSGVPVKPGNNVVFTVSGGIAGCAIKSAATDGLVVKPGAGAVFPVTGGCTISSAATDGLVIKSGTDAVFPVLAETGGCAISPATADGLAVKPGTDALFSISAGTGGCAISPATADGLAVKPGAGALFSVSAGTGGCAISPATADGLAVKPGAGALFSVSAGTGGCAISPATADGLVVKPGAGAVFPVSAEAGGCAISSATADGLDIKPATDAIFNIVSTNGLSVIPTTGLITQVGVLKNTGVRIGTSAVQTIFSLSLSANRLNPDARYFVSASGNNVNFDPDTPAIIDALFVYEVKGTTRDISFQYGVNIGTDLYLFVSMVYLPVMFIDPPPTFSDADSISFTVTYVPA